MRNILFVVLLITIGTLKAQEKQSVTQIRPGQVWNDSNGHQINAQGGGILFCGGIYYWYGTHKIEGLSEKTFADGGIHCYASRDLTTWADQGMVLSIAKDDSSTDLAFGCNFDRPKVVYNAKTRKFVAFFKLCLAGKGSETGYVGVALSESPSGPFTYSHKFLGAGSPNGSGDYAMLQEENGDLFHLTVRKPDKSFVVGKMRDDYLAIFDINKPENPFDSRSIWLPVVVKDDKFFITWRDSWDMNVFGD